MKKLAAIMALCACCLSAQTAKVIALSPEDAAKAKSLYQQQAEINKQLRELSSKITRTYLQEDDDWRSGFEYSDDYRFIVPKTPSTYPGPVTRLPYEIHPLSGIHANQSSITHLNWRTP